MTDTMRMILYLLSKETAKDLEQPIAKFHSSYIRKLEASSRSYWALGMEDEAEEVELDIYNAESAINEVILFARENGLLGHPFRVAAIQFLLEQE